MGGQMRATSCIPCLAMIILSYRRSPAFVRWRTPCVIALRLARGVLGLVAYPDLYNQDFAHTVVLPSSRRGARGGELELPWPPRRPPAALGTLPGGRSACCAASGPRRCQRKPNEASKLLRTHSLPRPAPPVCSRWW